MNKIIIGSFAFTAGIFLGYKVGEQHKEKEYVKWHETHRMRCWTPKKDIRRPGEYPQVFVIETEVANG